MAQQHVRVVFQRAVLYKVTGLFVRFNQRRRFLFKFVIVRTCFGKKRSTFLWRTIKRRLKNLFYVLPAFRGHRYPSASIIACGFRFLFTNNCTIFKSLSPWERVRLRAYAWPPPFSSFARRSRDTKKLKSISR